MADVILESEEQYFADLTRKDEPIRSLSPGMLREPIRRLEPANAVTLAPSNTVLDAVRVMQEHHIGCVVIVESDRLCGIFTERDLLQNVSGHELDPATTTLDGVMTRDPATLTPDAPMAWALNRMSHGGFRHIPLVDAEHRPAGIISVRDIVDYLVSLFPNEILTIPPDPGSNIPRSREGA